MTILVVENDVAWLADMKDVIRRVFRDEATFKEVTLVSEAEKLFEDPAYFDDVELALVDLELGGARGKDCADFFGRDKILPLIRRVARWVPVVLVTRYITGDSNILSVLTTHDFDAVIAKDFFSSPTVSGQDWAELRKGAALRRVACLTGRDTHTLAQRLLRSVVLEFGVGVEEQLRPFLLSRVVETVTLFDPGGDRVVLDEVVQGFSGLAVIRATCCVGERSTKWLLKFGAPIRKLDEEARAHRSMFVDGFTRQMSVPLFWWAPITCDGIGLIGYEFEEGTETLLDFAKRKGVDAALSVVGAALGELYQGSLLDSVVPRRYMRELVSVPREAWLLSGTAEASLVAAAIGDVADTRLDKSARLRVGCQHGDLHGRNVLVTAQGRALLIDFAHYRARAARGVPLLDIAKLMVDLAVFVDTEWSFGDLISGAALRSDCGLALAASCLVAQGKVSEDEVRVFSAAACCVLATYLRYKDASHKHAEIEMAFAGKARA